MADKLLGGTDPVTNELFKLTRGIGQGEGFDSVASVDESVNGGNVTVKTTTIMLAQSFVTQEPGSVDLALQVNFGAPQLVAEVDLDNLGNFTFLVEDEYDVKVRFQFGRTGATGESVTMGRALINGSQIGDTVYTVLDDGEDVIPTEFFGTLEMAVNDVLTFEIYRDSSGSNSGGVFQRAAQLVGWQDSPSTRILITRREAVAI